MESLVTCRCYISCSPFVVNVTMLEALRLRFFGCFPQLPTLSRVTSALPSDLRFSFVRLDHALGD